MILDQAGWHGSNALAVPANITLVPLPSYSPELNPVERIWRYLKERLHGCRIGIGHHQREGMTGAGLDGSEDVSKGKALVA